MESMDTQTPKSSNKVGIIISIVVVLAIISVIAWKISTVTGGNSTTNTTDNTTGTTTPVTSTTTPVVVEKKKYNDGTYTATGSYASPAGTEQLKISITLKDDVVTNAVFTGEAKNPASKTLQAQFAAGFKTYVIGKSIDSINLTVVNGSSLTPKGFMDALNKIKAEALITA